MTNIQGMEDKFLVVKRSDIQQQLTAKSQETLKELLKELDINRILLGKSKRSYLVINTDESYADQVISILKDHGHWGNAGTYPEIELLPEDPTETADSDRNSKCWFCGSGGRNAEMLFDTEFDTYLHETCLRLALSRITPEQRNDPEYINEALVMEYLLEEPTPARSINQLVQEAHANAVAKGWWKEDRSFGELTALVHSELSEALEDYRNGKHPNEEWYESKAPFDERTTFAFKREDFLKSQTFNEGGVLNPEWKPCGIPSELADVCIRIFDIAGRYDIDLERAINEKMAFNATRPQRHGGKVL